MNTKVNNNEVKANASVQFNNEVRTANNQLAFQRFCELCKEGYYIYVELKYPKKDNASFCITAHKENEEREEIRLFLNQEILDLVMNYLESGKLDDTSIINPNDLESFNEIAADFKGKLFQAEKRKRKNITWSYTVLEKLASIHYKQGVIIFHPYSYRNNPVNESSKKTEQENYHSSISNIIEDSFTQKEEVITPDFGFNYSLLSFSLYCTFAPAKRKECLLVNNKTYKNKKHGYTKNYRHIRECKRRNNFKC